MGQLGHAQTPYINGIIWIVRLALLLQALRMQLHSGWVHMLVLMYSCAQVPNIKGVEQLSVAEIAGHLGRLQQLAEQGHLHQEDLEGTHPVNAGSTAMVQEQFGAMQHRCSPRICCVTSVPTESA